jgi:hypothetical protein
MEHLSNYLIMMFRSGGAMHPVCSVLRARTALLVLLCAAAVPGLQAQAPPPAAGLDLSRAVVQLQADATPRERHAVDLLVDEVEARTRIRWDVVERAAPGQPAVRVGRHSGSPAPGREGYHLVSAGDSVTVAGADERGVLFGVGRLLRALEMRPGRIVLPAPLALTETPVVDIRGHQLGYRPKTNSYDGWDIPQWRQYMRDLAVFGANAIELIPPVSDDAADSPHFPRPQIEMMEAMSGMADQLGLDVWIWYPALEPDYTTEAAISQAVEEWSRVFARLPRVDAVFVPGGDPGHTEPAVMFRLLERQTAALRRHHPQATMWLSPQGFTAEWMETFYGLVATEPAWLTGVVIGPQNRDSIATVRERIPAGLRIRRYPDITHTIRAEFPVPLWDIAHARTSEREPINPRPLDQAAIFRKWVAIAPDFLTYSEGNNDDVNKVIWSALGWNPEADVAETLRQYGRYFLGPDLGVRAAEGLLALEENWRGPLAGHDGVARTLAHWQAIERDATPHDRLKWRLQQPLYRAYYDAYQQQRLRHEQHAEAQALEVLARARSVGSLPAMVQAEQALAASGAVVANDLRTRVFQLAEALYQSIRMQLSVSLYGAIAMGRGATLDLVDTPLNDRVWLLDRFAEIRALPTERERLLALDRIARWTDPGPGGFYDDLGNPERQPRLVAPPPFREDPGPYQAGMTGFGWNQAWRLSWMRHAEAFYDGALEMRYEGLDPASQYRVRVVYAGDMYSQTTRVRLTADDEEVHGYMPKPSPVAPVEFAVPRAATADGRLLLSWRAQPGIGGAGRGCQVAEVWLIKEPE